jgi:poly(3-hydroxybutyrate) depolymerase
MRLSFGLAALLVVGCGDGAVATDDLGGGDGPAADLAGAGDGAQPGDLAGAVPLQPGDSTLTLNVAGQMRSVILHVPAAVTAGPLPLVIALHGNGDTAANFVAANTLKTRADTLGLVLAAPQGITQSITYMGTPINNISWDAYRSTAQGNIDLPLIDAIRGQLAQSGSIDVKKVFVLGYSQGGYLAFHAGMAGSGVLSCTAVIAAANPLGAQLIAQATRKIPVTLQIGSNDGAVQNARNTRDALMGAGHPVSYDEIAGAGHVPFPGDASVPLMYCKGQSLP